MARVLLGPLVSDARGKEGGLVFSRNAAGAYTRAKVSPKQPRSPLQLAIRNAASTCAVYWRDTATPTIRAAWETYAKTCLLTDCFGKRGPRSGMAVFLRTNVPRLYLGRAMITAAPLLTGEATIPSLTLAATVALGVQITAISPTLASGDIMWVLKSRSPMSQARNYYSTPFTKYGDLDHSTTFPCTVIPPAQCAIGQRWFLRARIMDAAGRVSTAATFRVDVLT
jgi:hypothetical protein